jgi:predicted short-subunit dehydrogenase-like oxidoreductase (DUF2520 family)
VSAAASGDKMAVFVLGAGRAGRGLADALRGAGVAVIGVHGRRVQPGITTGALPDTVSDATAIIVAVRDAQLDGALSELLSSLRAAGRASRPVVLHLSGGANPVGLAALRRAGYPAGTFHPLVPLADPARAAASLRNAWIGVDGDAAAIAAGRALADRLGAHVLEIPAGEKPRYHAAAVLASNFPAVLAALAVKLMRGAGVSPEAARGAVDALLRASVANLEGAEPAAVLTGPVVRGDVATVRAHLAALEADPLALEVYRVLSGAAVRLLDEAGMAEAARLTEIRDALASRDSHSPFV